MKKLSVLAVLVFVVLAGIWIGCRCAAELVSPAPVEPSPTEVIEPTPTEKIEEPTPTPVPPTPVPPTPTPEPTSVPPTPTPTPQPQYVGLPAAEVERLREQCLRENPNLLCLPLPLDPTQPGVEIFFLQDKHGDRVFESLGIRAPAGTVFSAPCTGVYKLSYRCSLQDGELVCDESSGAPGLDCELLHLPCLLAESSRLTPSDFSDPALYDEIMRRGIQLTLGDIHFTLKTDDLAEFPSSGLVSDPGVQVFILAYVGSDHSRHSFNEDDLLRDEQGRIVFIQP